MCVGGHHQHPCSEHADASELSRQPKLGGQPYPSLHGRGSLDRAAPAREKDMALAISGVLKQVSDVAKQLLFRLALAQIIFKAWAAESQAEGPACQVHDAPVYSLIFLS